MRSYSMVRTWWHKLFSKGQSGVQRGDRRARVRQRLLQKPWLQSLEARCLLSYQITDLGTLPGDSGSDAFGKSSFKRVIFLVQVSFDEELLHGPYVVAQTVFERAIGRSARRSSSPCPAAAASEALAPIPRGALLVELSDHRPGHPARRYGQLRPGHQRLRPG